MSFLSGTTHLVDSRQILDDSLPEYYSKTWNYCSIFFGVPRISEYWASIADATLRFLRLIGGKNFHTLNTSSSHFLLSSSFSCTMAWYRFISALILLVCCASSPVLSWGNGTIEASQHHGIVEWQRTHNHIVVNLKPCRHDKLCSFVVLYLTREAPHFGI